MIRNDYYHIALEDLKYLQATLHLPYYNNIVISTQQIAEKMLKSVAERVIVNCEHLMHSHNLRALYDAIYAQYQDFSLNRGDLSMLKDYYFDAKYPGDNFVNVTKSECEQCLNTMYDTIEFVNNIRKQLCMDYSIIERKMLKTDTNI